MKTTTSETPKLMSINAYAKYRGTHWAKVAKHLKRAGLTGLIDPAVADPIMDAANEHPRSFDQHGGIRPGGVRPGLGDDGTSPTGETFRDAERRHKLAKAKQEELKLRKLQGELVTRSAVQKAEFTMARSIRDALENLPSRIAGLIAAMAPGVQQEAIFALLTKEIHQTLEELSA